MAAEKFSISFDPELFREVRDAAAEDEQSLSAWMAEAARHRLRGMAMDHFLTQVLEETGLSEEEVLAAAAEAERSAIRTSGSLEPEGASKPKARAKTKRKAGPKSKPGRKAPSTERPAGQRRTAV